MQLPLCIVLAVFFGVNRLIFLSWTDHVEAEALLNFTDGKRSQLWCNAEWKPLHSVRENEISFYNAQTRWCTNLVYSWLFYSFECSVLKISQWNLNITSQQTCNMKSVIRKHNLEDTRANSPQWTQSVAVFQVKIDLQSFLLLMSKFAFGNNVKNFFVCVEYKFHAHTESC